MDMKHQGWLWVGLLWFVFAVIGYGLFYTSDNSGSLILWISIFFLPAIILFFIFFGAIWVLLIDDFPKYLLRLWQGPPWKTPRRINAFGPLWEQRYHDDLLKRLEELHTDPATRTRYYIDKVTKQKWIGEYTETKFGYGVDLIPERSQT